MGLEIIIMIMTRADRLFVRAPIVNGVTYWIYDEQVPFQSVNQGP